MDGSKMTPETCSMQYMEAWDETHQPDPINTMMTTTLGKEISQLQADEFCSVLALAFHLYCITLLLYCTLFMLRNANSEVFECNDFFIKFSF